MCSSLKYPCPAQGRLKEIPMWRGRGRWGGSEAQFFK